jgi:3',5'-cyclic AMP phosphodiesterase CpdA
MFKILYYLVSLLLIFSINSSFAQNLKFVQITDPHIFEANHRNKESRNSLVYFYLSIEKANDINIDLKRKGEEELDFILMSGDLGIEKLLKLEPISKNPEAFKFTQDGETFALVKDQEKWDGALQALTKLLQDSEVKTWLFVPGNNDIYEDSEKIIEKSSLVDEYLGRLKLKKHVCAIGKYISGSSIDLGGGDVSLKFIGCCFKQVIV